MYEKGKGIFVGEFNINEVLDKIDRKKTQEFKEKYNLDYVNTEIVKKGNKIIGIKIWVCNIEDADFGGGR